MKKIFILSFTLLFVFESFAQNSDPYKVFGYTSKVKYESTYKIAFSELLYIKVKDTFSNVKAVAFDMGSGYAFKLGSNDTILDKIKIEPNQILRWISIDPLSAKYPQFSPYAAMADNPIKYIDPDGRKFINFDEKGNYTNTTKDNWWHNLWHGSQGRVLDSHGNVEQKFRFADPKHDVADIQNGIIKKIEFVKEEDVSKMMQQAGVFNPHNKSIDGNGRYKYILKEGVGGGKFDFSYSAIPDMYPEASRDPQNPETPSPIIFLIDGIAHNHMNFGNFLFGAAGAGIGLSLPELLLGGHWNSLFGKKNAYSSQFDSSDDQYSISLGFDHGYNNEYKQREVNRTTTIQIGPVLPF